MGHNEPVRPDYVVLEEEIEENYQPTQQEISEYAEWLGMELPRDKDLLWIAHDGLTKPLGKEWKPCRTEEDEIYYFNFETGESRWDHPCEEFHRNLLQNECQKLGRPLAKQLWMQCGHEPSSSSQSNFKRNNEEHQDEDAHEEASPHKTLADGGGGTEYGPDQQTDDVEGSQMKLVSEMRSEKKELRSLRTGNKEEEDREMASQRAQMMAEVRKKIDEEESSVLQRARRAMQERVDMVIKVEEMGLLADERLKMSDVVAKQVESDIETEVARLRSELETQVANQIEGERDQMVKEERANMYNEVVKQIREERATEVARKRRESQIAENVRREVDEEDLKTEGGGQLKSSKAQSKQQQSGYEVENYPRPRLDTTDSRLQDARREHMLHSELSSLAQYPRIEIHSEDQFLTASERREVVQTVKRKLKLEELVLFDEMREKMVLRVRESISALERSMFEEEHRSAIVGVRDKVDELYKRILKDAELQMLQEKESALRENTLDLKKRLQELATCDNTMSTEKLTSSRSRDVIPVTATSIQSKEEKSEKSSRGRLSVGAIEESEVPVASSSDSIIASKWWRAENDEEKNVKVEYLWSNKEPCRDAGNILEVTVISGALPPSLHEHSAEIQVVRHGRAENAWNGKHSGSVSRNSESSVASGNLHFPEWSAPSEEEPNVNVEYLWSNMNCSRVAPDRLKIPDASLDTIPELKSWKSRVEESLKDLMGHFRKELKKELRSLREYSEVASPPSGNRQEPSRIPFVPLTSGWTSEVQKEIRDLVHHCRNELEKRISTLKDEMKEELKVLLPLKDQIAVPQILPRKVQTSQEIRAPTAEVKEMQIEHCEKPGTRRLEEHKADSDICKDRSMVTSQRSLHKQNRSKIERCDENQCYHLVSYHSNTNAAHISGLDIHRANDIAVHVSLEGKKSKLSSVQKWISQPDASRELNSTPEFRVEQQRENVGQYFTMKQPEHVESRESPSIEKTLGNIKRCLRKMPEEQFRLPCRLNSVGAMHQPSMLANESNWKESMYRSRGIEDLAAALEAVQEERSRLQTARLNRWVQKHMKWIMQQISSGWRRADTICLKCGMAIRQMVRRLDSGRAIVVSLVQKSRRECKMGRYKGAQHVRAIVDAEISSWHDRQLDRSPRKDPRKRYKNVQGWIAVEEQDHKEPRTSGNLNLLHDLGAHKRNPSDFHLALNPQRNDGTVKWLFSDSELEELRDLWNMDADYASPCIAQEAATNQRKSEVQVSGKWTPEEPVTRAGNRSIFQETEDRNSYSTSNNIDPDSGRETSSTSRKKWSDFDMQELQDAIATFRQSRETLIADNSGKGQTEGADYEQRMPNEILKAHSTQDMEGMANKELELKLSQHKSQARTNTETSEIEEVEEKAPGFITLEFAKSRSNGSTLQGMQTGSSNCDHCKPALNDQLPHSVSQNGWSNVMASKNRSLEFVFSRTYAPIGRCQLPHPTAEKSDGLCKLGENCDMSSNSFSWMAASSLAIRGSYTCVAGGCCSLVSLSTGSVSEFRRR